MMILFILLLNLFALASTPEVSCDKAIAKVVTHFEYSDPRLKLKQSDSLLLGEGAWGVVTLIQKNEIFKAIKSYKNKDQAAHDQKALQYLKKTLLNTDLKIIQSELNNSTTMELEYAFGRTLEDLYYDLETSTELKSQLKKKYIKIFLELVTHFEASDFLIDINHNELPRVSAQNDDFPPKGLYFIIKPDNIIVNPNTLDFYLIDPS